MTECRKQNLDITRLGFEIFAALDIKGSCEKMFRTRNKGWTTIDINMLTDTLNKNLNNQAIIHLSMLSNVFRYSNIPFRPSFQMLSKLRHDFILFSLQIQEDSKNVFNCFAEWLCLLLFLIIIPFVLFNILNCFSRLNLCCK